MRTFEALRVEPALLAGVAGVTYMAICHYKWYNNHDSTKYRKRELFMKITSVTLTNFRGYKGTHTIYLDDLTVFVGRNDIGKSSVLEALDLFFNETKASIKFDVNDINMLTDEDYYSVGCTFSEYPDSITIDATHSTSLEDEYLLNENGELEIIKTYLGGNKWNKTIIRAMHPTNENCCDLLQKKNAALKSIIDREAIPCENNSINSIMRSAIWSHYKDDLNIQNTDIDVNKGDDCKSIWHGISDVMPLYSLFKSDRSNDDGDKEVQDPLKAAVDQFLKDPVVQDALKEVAIKVTEKLNEVAVRTLEKLNEMDSNVAESLNPVIPDSRELKWSDVFKKVSITSDNDISINKRGSGTKRLILLNFFRAEAEYRRSELNTGTIIYAIEEPETSQHFANQVILADSLKKLSEAENTQVLLTTHSGVMVKRFPYTSLKLIGCDEDGSKTVDVLKERVLNYASLNEINFTAFDEATAEYHDELYGFILSNNYLEEFEDGKPTRPYIRELPDGSIRNELRTLSHYIRDVMHHPENHHNNPYTLEELSQSILDMRLFIESKR